MAVAETWRPRKHGVNDACTDGIEDRVMLDNRAVDAELRRSLNLSIKEIAPILAAGGDAAEKKFMECCRCLWRADGIELVEPFIEAAFNRLPEHSRSVLFQRMLTIVYVAQDNEIKSVKEKHSR